MDLRPTEFDARIRAHEGLVYIELSSEEYHIRQTISVSITSAREFGQALVNAADDCGDQVMAAATRDLLKVNPPAQNVSKTSKNWWDLRRIQWGKKS